MLNHSNPTTTWTLITIVDPAGLPGKSIFDIIQLILERVKFRFIILDYISGGGKSGIIFSLQNKA